MIFIDSREPDFVKYGLPVDLGIDASIMALQAGDIMLVEDGHTMLIERKTTLDLLNSITDGRLMDQCARMMEICQLPLVLCHGDLKCDRDGKVVADGRTTRFNWWSLHMALLSLQAGGVMYLQVRQGDLTDAIKYLRSWISKDSHLIVRRREPLPFLTPAKGLQILASLPNIDMKKGQMLLDYYGKAGHALAELTHVGAVTPKGIGPKTVENVRGAMGLEESERLVIEHILEE